MNTVYPICSILFLAGIVIMFFGSATKKTPGGKQVVEWEKRVTKTIVKKTAQATSKGAIRVAKKIFHIP